MTSLLFDVLGVQPVRALYLASIANGMCVPAILATLLLLGRSSRVLGSNRIDKVVTVLLAIGLAVTLALPIAYLVS